MSQVNTGPIINPKIFIKPSDKLRNYISNIKITDDLPSGISSIVYKNKVKLVNKSSTKIEPLIKEEDEKFIINVTLEVKKEDNITTIPFKQTTVVSTDKLLSLEDLHWLYNYIQKQNKVEESKFWLHELVEGSEIVLPKNEEIPRNEELDKRCKKLKEEQANKEYLKMTKNVDNKRKVLPEDTIGYQVKQMNKHLVAVFQFIMSVIAGFVFGFIGIELMIGHLDFGFRLLLGIICALTIALAELYFLAKKLNEDLQYEYEVDKQKGIKLD